MGTRGTGRLEDYPQSKRGKTRKGGGGSGGSGNGGGKHDECTKPVSASLEEVDRCDYLKNHGTPPAVGTLVKVSMKKRLAVTTKTGEVIGFLPTNLNYLAGCIADGHKYQGTIQNVATKPVIQIQVDIRPA